jgi:DNA primase
VSDFVSLKRKGQNLWACCPFHDEKTPSFSVAPNKGIYKCFGCGKAGDAIQFVQEVEGVNFVGALRYLAAKYNIEIEEDRQETPEQAEAQNQRESLLIALKNAAAYFENLLWENEEGKSIGYSYFKERGFPDQVIRKFGLGFSLDAWDGLLKHAQVTGLSEEVLEKAGLIIVKDEKKYDRFRGRVIFPLHNLAGNVIAFGARILKTTKGKEQPKYLNSPETEVYEKSKNLYGIFQARQAIRQQDNCYLVEGYTDVISLHLNGIENVVSSSGTSLTVEQIKLIGRFTKNITVLYDGDPAGIKASLRGIDLILENDLNARICIFPEGEDPDSYSHKIGSTAFQTYLQENTTDFIRFKTALLTRESKNDPVKKASSIREIVRSISLIRDPIQRAVYLKESSQMLEMDENLLYAELNKVILERKRKENRSQEKDQPPPPDSAEYLPQEAVQELLEQVDPDKVISLQEKESVRLLLNYSLNEIEQEFRLYEFMLQELEEIEFITPVYAQILQLFKQKLREGEVANLEFFLKETPDHIREAVAELITEKYELSDNWEKKYQIYVPRETWILKSMAFTNVYRLKFRVIRKLIGENMKKMQETADIQEQERLLYIHTQLKQAEIEAAKILGNVIAR